MEQAAVEQSASLIPIAQNHCHISSFLGARRSDAGGILNLFHEVVLEVPVACLTKCGLSPQVIELKLKLRLVMRGLSFGHRKTS